MKTRFTRSFVVLARNWIILLPSIAIGVLSAAAAWALSSAGYLSWQFFGNLNAQGPRAFWMFFGTIVAFSLRVLGALITIALTTGMAGAAWTRGSARLADGFASFRRDGVQLLAVLAVLFLIGLAASAIVIPTFGISLLAYMVFTIYAMPAVVVGERAATEAVVESIQIAARNFGVTFALAALVVVLAVFGGLLGGAAARLPYLGEVIRWLVMEIVVAYATVFVVGEYLNLQPVAKQEGVPRNI